MKTGQSATLALAPVLDITAAGPLAAEFMRCRGKDVVVDASRVEKLGAQCIQVLLSAVATWTHDGAEFELVDASGTMVDALDTAGLEVANFSARNA